MNFANILDEWDKRSGKTPQEIPYSKDESNDLSSGKSRADKALERQRRLRKKPDAVIDLHGLTSDLAWGALDEFFNTSHSLGHEKVLVIHGKGNHSENESVLKTTTMKFIEHCPFAGQSGRSDAAMGGSGATWVLLKN